MKLEATLESVERTMTTRFREPEAIKHAGDRGEQREEFLREFLSAHLPRRFGIAKGEVLSPRGEQSHSADIVIYDAANCPLVYNERTQIIPIEGVYGIIEVKSRLSKNELFDALSKIAAFKGIPMPDIAAGPTIGREVQLYRTSRPFGVVFAFDLADNSLDSLMHNWREYMGQSSFERYANFVSVLGSGVVQIEMVHKTNRDRKPIIDSKLLWQQMMRSQRDSDYEFAFELAAVETGSRTFGRFFVYLAVVLEQMRLGTPDLLAYLDPELPILFDTRVTMSPDNPEQVEILADSSLGEMKVILPPANEF